MLPYANHHALCLPLLSFTFTANLGNVLVFIFVNVGYNLTISGEITQFIVVEVEICLSPESQFFTVSPTACLCRPNGKAAYPTG